MPRLVWWRAAAWRARRSPRAARRRRALDQGGRPHGPPAQGGLGQTPRARQHRTAAPHGVRLAALGPHLEPRSAVRDRHLLLFVRTERAAPFAALLAPCARPQPERA